ncbi:MAG: NAD(+)/NADH kinase [Ruminococcaceae bacterium]|nr:NAD(+)/NADH kinase [Oscillospiraceae bacterium]
MKIGIIINIDKAQAVICGEQIVKLMIQEKADVLLNNSVKEITNLTEYKDNIDFFDTDEAVIAHSDLAITVGGDGTIIHNAKFATTYKKPLIGVNMGRIGFVAGIEYYEIKELKKLLLGEYKIQRRMLLNVELKRGNEIKRFLAVNEAAITRDVLKPIIDISVLLNNERIITYRADGMIFATPTGSTAYSFSCGGPVIEPDMDCILLTPLCPHALSSRQVVFREDSTLTAIVDNADVSHSYLVVDGQTNVEIQKGDEITITKSDDYLELIILKEKNFYTLLNEKLKEKN